MILGVPKVGLRCTSCQHEIVVAGLSSRASDKLGLEVNTHDSRQDNLHVLLISKSLAEGRGHIRRSELGGGYLVEKRLKQVVVVVVYQRNVHGRALETTDDLQPAEATSDNNNPRSPSSLRGVPLRHGRPYGLKG